MVRNIEDKLSESKFLHGDGEELKKCAVCDQSIDSRLTENKKCERCGQWLCRNCKIDHDCTKAIMAFLCGNWSINYAVRNLTTLDEEETRLWDDQITKLESWGETVTDEELQELFNLMKGLETAEDRWTHRYNRIKEILLPYISNRELYDMNYSLWQELLFEYSDNPVCVICVKRYSMDQLESIGGVGDGNVICPNCKATRKCRATVCTPNKFGYCTDKEMPTDCPIQ
jgi:hypothetical protein